MNRRRKSVFKRVLRDRLDKRNMFWEVTAWDAEDAVGRTVAYVDSLTGRVIILDSKAIHDSKAKTQIRQCVKESRTSMDDLLSRKQLIGQIRQGDRESYSREDLLKVISKMPCAFD